MGQGAVSFSMGRRRRRFAVSRKREGHRGLQHACSSFGLPSSSSSQMNDTFGSTSSSQMSDTAVGYASLVCDDPPG